MMITLVIIAALAAIAVPAYQSYIERARRAQAINDIAELSIALERYYTLHFSYPPDLAAVGGAPTDPWGNPYQYLAIDIDPAPPKGHLRKDKNMSPINTDFDLYSMGADGRTNKQLVAAGGRDDIVRAANGGFIGLASEH